MQRNAKYQVGNKTRRGKLPLLSPWGSRVTNPSTESLARGHLCRQENALPFHVQGEGWAGDVETKPPTGRAESLGIAPHVPGNTQTGQDLTWDPNKSSAAPPAAPRLEGFQWPGLVAPMLGFSNSACRDGLRGPTQLPSPDQVCRSSGMCPGGFCCPDVSGTAMAPRAKHLTLTSGCCCGCSPGKEAVV